MKKIVGVLQPFDAMQKIFVYEQGHQINSKECSLEQLPKALFIFSNWYETDTINLFGPAFFVDKVKQNIDNESMKEYGYKKLNIIKV